MIIVTGSARGIGKHLFEHFPAEEVLGIFNQTTPANPRSKSHKLDIGCEREVDLFFQEHGPRLSNIVLINCAGIAYNSAAHKADLALWKKVVEVNLFGTFNLIRNVLPLMRKDNYGRIINFSSVAPKGGWPGPAPMPLQNPPCGGWPKPWRWRTAAGT